MKIKIIDLLIKIANGEENTKVKTKYDSVDWVEKDFLFSVYNEFNSRNNAEIVEFLNDYVKIIEEPKKIEKLPKEITDNACATRDQRIIANKIDELIDEINNLKEK